MKKHIILLVLLFTISLLKAQVGIGTTNPDESALLELRSTTQGFLMPRLTTAQRNLIESPAEGLLIYNTTEKCYQMYNSQAWSLCQGESEDKALDCSTTVKGFYVQNTALNSSNKLIASVTTTKAGAYSITTNTVNGYSFSATGVFDSAGTYSIELVGTGIPISVQVDAFTITLAGTVTTCTVDVEVLATTPPIYANCKGYLDAYPSSASGVYTIDPDGVGVGNSEFECYCDMDNDGGGWTLVFRHDFAGGLFSTNSEADSFNVSSPSLTTQKYSILNSIDDLKSATDYEFRLYYPESSTRNHWTQSSSPRNTPATGSRVTNYVEISIDADSQNWGGLELSTSSSTYIDGSVDSGNWFYAIGAKSSYQGGFPGPNGGVSIVELYIR